MVKEINMTKKEILKQLKDGRSFIKNEFLTPQNIHDYLYIIKEPLKGHVHYFENSYNIVAGSFRDNIEFIYPDGQKDYLIFSKNSGSSLPQEIFIGNERDGQIYFMGETFPMSHGFLSLIIAPDSSYFDHKVKGF